jgi:arylsulfatase A-like enzyme
MFQNDLTHEPAFFAMPDYTPTSTIGDKGPGPFAAEDHYHANMAAFLLLGKWFAFLQENGVYDNTRIIIVSDHGSDIPHSPFPNNITLPNGQILETYNSLLLVKDFYADNPLATKNTFMTNADVPVLATDNLIQNPINPFSKKPIVMQKENGATITTAANGGIKHQLKYAFKVESKDWLHVKDDIFKPENWSTVEVR